MIIYNKSLIKFQFIDFYKDKDKYKRNVLRFIYYSKQHHRFKTFIE